MTASAFDMLEGAALATLDQVFAEAVTFHPQAAPPNGRPGPDPARAVQTVSLSVSRFRPPRSASLDIPGTDNAPLASRFAVEARAYVPVGVLAYAPAQGDILATIDNGVSRRWRVASVEPDGPARSILHLLLIGQGA
jgi:hypothetical protein